MVRPLCVIHSNADRFPLSMAEKHCYYNQNQIKVQTMEKVKPLLLYFYEGETHAVYLKVQTVCHVYKKPDDGDAQFVKYFYAPDFRASNH